MDGGSGTYFHFSCGVGTNGYFLNVSFFSNNVCTTAASNMPEVVSAPLDQFFGPLQCLDTANGAPKDTDDIAR